MQYGTKWLGAAGLVITTAAVAQANSAKPTYAKDVAPILNQNCVACHRPGEIGPMSLLTYDEVRPWAKSIKQYVAEGVMPPWHADPGFGPWKNERKLRDDQIATIVNWVDAGAPQGNPQDAPPAPKFEEGAWILGEPDYIIEFEEVKVPADGKDDFYNLEHKTNFDEDKWIRAVEIKPGDRSVVHHVILWQGSQQSAQGWLDAWAAGAGPTVMPEGTGRLLQKGATIIGDMHYHPAEKDAVDVTRVGLHFGTDEDIKKELVNLWISNASFQIPAGDPNHEVRSSHTFTQDSILLTLTPHMHYRGKDFSYVATFPDGKQTELLKVSKYDFNWQTGYIFEEPLEVPKGTRIDCLAHFDNSPNNPDNPDPTKNVTFGLESYDEMMIGFVDYIVKDGVRPVFESDTKVLAKVEELVAADPGQVWTINIGNPGQPQLSALHIPREGEGGWHVLFNGAVMKARIYEIAWSGNDFTTKMMIPGQGTNDIKGTVVPGEKVIKLTMTDATGNVQEGIIGNLAE